MLQLPQLLGLKPILANCPDEEGLRPLHLAVLAGKVSLYLSKKSFFIFFLSLVSLDLSKKELRHLCPLHQGLGCSEPCGRWSGSWRDGQERQERFALGGCVQAG